MDTALASSIVNTATQLASARNSDALNVRVLKKALDVQETNAQLLLNNLPQIPQNTALATSGSVGTQVNTWA